MDLEKKIAELQANETFLCKLAEIDDAETIKKLFEEYGVDISLEDAKEALTTIEGSQKEELSDADLEDVSGGGVVSAAGKFVAWLIGYAYETYRPKKKGKKSKK